MMKIPDEILGSAGESLSYAQQYLEHQGDPAPDRSSPKEFPKQLLP